MKTTKPSNYLSLSHHEFTDYHLYTANAIYKQLINKYLNNEDLPQRHC